MNAGLDAEFVKYGVRKTDLRLIETIAQKHDLDIDWVRDYLLKAFHEEKNKTQEVDDKKTEQIITSALQKL